MRVRLPPPALGAPELAAALVALQARVSMGEPVDVSVEVDVGARLVGSAGAKAFARDVDTSPATAPTLADPGGRPR
jgi:hypothetical protein